MKQKRAWLRARQIDDVNGKTKRVVIEEKFNYYVSLPEESRPVIVEIIASKATLQQVEYMLTCWHVCIPTDGTIDDIERHIKLFLSAVDDFD